MSTVSKTSNKSDSKLNLNHPGKEKQLLSIYDKKNPPQISKKLSYSAQFQSPRLDRHQTNIHVATCKVIPLYNASKMEECHPCPTTSAEQPRATRYCACNSLPPLRPCPANDDLWNLQFCRWWGWNWIRKREEMMNKQKEPMETKPDKESLNEPNGTKIKKKDQFFSWCGKLFKNKVKQKPLKVEEKKQLKELYATPCSSVTCPYATLNDWDSQSLHFEGDYECCSSSRKQSCPPTIVIHTTSKNKECRENARKHQAWICEKTESSSSDECCPCISGNPRKSSSCTAEDSMDYLSLRMDQMRSECEDSSRCHCAKTVHRRNPLKLPCNCGGHQSKTLPQCCRRSSPCKCAQPVKIPRFRRYIPMFGHSRCCNCENKYKRVHLCACQVPRCFPKCSKRGNCSCCCQNSREYVICCPCESQPRKKCRKLDKSQGQGDVPYKFKSTQTSKQLHEESEECSDNCPVKKEMRTLSQKTIQLNNEIAKNVLAEHTNNDQENYTKMFANLKGFKSFNEFYLRNFMHNSTQFSVSRALESGVYASPVSGRTYALNPKTFAFKSVPYQSNLPKPINISEKTFVFDINGSKLQKMDEEHNKLLNAVCEAIMSSQEPENESDMFDFKFKQAKVEQSPTPRGYLFMNNPPLIKNTASYYQEFSNIKHNQDLLCPNFYEQELDNLQNKHHDIFLSSQIKNTLFQHADLPTCTSNFKHSTEHKPNPKVKNLIQKAFDSFKIGQRTNEMEKDTFFKKAAPTRPLTNFLPLKKNDIATIAEIVDHSQGTSSRNSEADTMYKTVSYSTKTVGNQSMPFSNYILQEVNKNHNVVNTSKLPGFSASSVFSAVSDLTSGETSMKGKPNIPSSFFKETYENGTKAFKPPHIYNVLFSTVYPNLGGNLSNISQNSSPPLPVQNPPLLLQELPSSNAEQTQTNNTGVPNSTRTEHTEQKACCKNPCPKMSNRPVSPYQAGASTSTAAGCSDFQRRKLLLQNTMYVNKTHLDNTQQDRCKMACDNVKCISNKCNKACAAGKQKCKAQCQTLQNNIVAAQSPLPISEKSDIFHGINTNVMVQHVQTDMTPSYGQLAVPKITKSFGTDPIDFQNNLFAITQSLKDIKSENGADNTQSLNVNPFLMPNVALEEIKHSDIDKDPITTTPSLTDQQYIKEITKSFFPENHDISATILEEPEIITSVTNVTEQNTPQNQIEYQIVQYNFTALENEIEDQTLQPIGADSETDEQHLQRFGLDSENEVEEQKLPPPLSPSESGVEDENAQPVPPLLKRKVKNRNLQLLTLASNNLDDHPEVSPNTSTASNRTFDEMVENTHSERELRCFNLNQEAPCRPLLTRATPLKEKPFIYEDKASTTESQNRLGGIKDYHSENELQCLNLDDDAFHPYHVPGTISTKSEIYHALYKPPTIQFLDQKIEFQNLENGHELLHNVSPANETIVPKQSENILGIATRDSEVYLNDLQFISKNLPSYNSISDTSIPVSTLKRAQNNDLQAIPVTNDSYSSTSAFLISTSTSPINIPELPKTYVNSSTSPFKFEYRGKRETEAEVDLERRRPIRRESPFSMFCLPVTSRDIAGSSRQGSFMLESRPERKIVVTKPSSTLKMREKRWRY